MAVETYGAASDVVACEHLRTVQVYARKLSLRGGVENTNSKRVARKMREYNIDNNCMCSVHQ